jgi:hypothetical protein
MKKTPREKLISGLKRRGYDVEKSHKYWTDMSKEIEKQRKEYEKQGLIKKQNTELKERCWPGHRAVPGKKPYSPGSCVKEDGVPVNNVGGGNIAGVGVGPQGEPGVNPKRKRNIVPFNVFSRKQK